MIRNKLAAASIDPTVKRIAVDIARAIKNPVFQDLQPEVVERQSAAEPGQTNRGSLKLPSDLQDVAFSAYKSREKESIVAEAGRLYEDIRKFNLKGRNRKLLYSHKSAPAYVSGLMPWAYGATYHALDIVHTNMKDSKWEPERIVDFGCGSGSVAWAVDAIWGSTTKANEPREYVGLDSSSHMIEISKPVIAALNNKIIPFAVTEEEGRMKVATHQIEIPATDSSMGTLHLGPRSSVPAAGGKRTLAIAAFTLGEQSSTEHQNEILEAMWKLGAEIIVVIDKGTLPGKDIVLNARSNLLHWGKLSEDLPLATKAPIRGSHVIAPCPHDGKCPLADNAEFTCTFNQRILTPAATRFTKQTKRGYEDAQFSFVAIRRGPRPPPSDIKQISEWSRIIDIPKKMDKHVHLRVCTSSGELMEHTIAKSQGTDVYTDARKARAGDGFPHECKGEVKPITLPKLSNYDYISKLRGRPEVDDSQLRRDSKLRSRKLRMSEDFDVLKGEPVDVRELFTTSQ